VQYVTVVRLLLGEERERDPTSLLVYNTINHQNCITEYERAEQSGMVDSDMIVV